MLGEAGFAVLRTRTDHPSGTDRLAEANAVLGAPAVINVQGDEPLVAGEQIRASLLALKEMPLLRRLPLLSCNRRTLPM